MHIVKLFLKVVDLLFQGCLAVELFLAVFLGFLSFSGDFCHLHEFIDCFFDERISGFYGILGKDGVLFIYTQVQVFGQRRY